MAGEGSVTTSTVTAPIATSPAPSTGRSGASAGAVVVRSSRWWMAPTTTAVTAAAASPAGAKWVKKARPERWRWPSTIRLVRFDPGSSSEPALDSSRQAYSRAASPSPLLRAA